MLGRNREPVQFREDLIAIGVMVVFVVAIFWRIA